MVKLSKLTRYQLKRIHLLIKKEKRKRKKDRSCEFLKDEIKEIEIHKWIESQKAHRNLGLEAELDWVCKYAKAYREEWELKYGKIIEEIEEENGVNCSGCPG